jgi:hypothetical protein
MDVYWFQDSKTGHLKQVQTLLDQLKKETELSITTINDSNQESFSEIFSNKDQKFFRQKNTYKNLLLRIYFR